MPESIVDATRPNGGRIYDYMLGGHHNFEVDRQAGEQMIKMMPFTPKAARLQRWCLRDIAEELTHQRGFDLVIDFASGLPTNDHIHEHVKPGTTVIYSDSDPITVEYAREILKGVPNTYYFHADACHPEDLFTRPEVLALLHGRRDIAFVLWGVSTFISPPDLRHLSRYLYDWCGPAGQFVFQAQAADANPNDPGTALMRKIYEQTATPLYVYSLQEYRELIQPWRPDAEGFISLLEWNGMDQTIMTEGDKHTWGPSGIGYGAYLVKAK